jgi:uncharacterized protein
MRLKSSGGPEVTLPRPWLWIRVIDPHFVARSAPGVATVEVLDSTHVKVISGFGVGSIKLRFALDVELIEVTEPLVLAFTARGRAPGSAVEVAARLALEELGEGRTRLNWTAETMVSGTVASVGARLMEGTARKLTDMFWQDFARNAEAAGAPEESPAPPTEAPESPPPASA